MSTTTTRPQSRTFRGPEETGAPSVTGLPGVRRDDVSPVQVLETERYDTGDLRLAAVGITLAVVRGSTPASWQLDLPDGGHPERFHVPVAVDNPAGGRIPVPSEIAELVRGAARKRTVRPVGRVRTLRTVHGLMGDDDRVLAQVIHDHVTLSTMGRSTEVQAWTEMTVEQLEADAELLDGLVGRVREAGLRPAAPSADAELARLLRPATPGRATMSRSSAGGALMAYVATQADRIAVEDLRVRRGEPDSVHQLRVAARRMRSALQGYRPLLTEERSAPLVEGLRELGRACAPARDAGVLRERIMADLDDMPDTLRLGHAAAFATRHFARMESEAAAAALAALDGAAYSGLRDAIDAFLADPPLLGRAVRPAREELPRHVATAARRVQKAVAAAGAEHGSDEAVHAARKAAKRLRYVTEVARPASAKPAKRFGSAIKRLQKTLGEHQDCVVVRQELRRLGALAHAEGENGFSFGVLHGRASATAARVEAELPRLWKKTWTTRNRRWLR